ncbi:MAG: sulfotransferase domain-containing protein [Chlamydiales bacterium]
MNAKFFIFPVIFVYLSFAGGLTAGQKKADVPKDWQRVYLASFPRSGNHWVRYLIEEASLIATSSVRRDRHPQHLKKAFPWGGFCADHGYTGNCRYPQKEDIVLIKTHFPAGRRASQFDGFPFVQTIRLIRHPVDSFYSEYVRRLGLQGEQPLEKIPHQLVIELIDIWKRFQNYWDNQKDVVTIRYEDILDNPSENLKTILLMINYKVEDADIERAVAKYPPEGFVLKHKDKFDPEDLELINLKLKIYMKKFGYSI